MMDNITPEYASGSLSDGGPRLAVSPSDSDASSISSGFHNDNGRLGREENPPEAEGKSDSEKETEEEQEFGEIENYEAITQTAGDTTEDEDDFDAPLRAMLPPEFQNVDIRAAFPEFRRREVLRFSRLFGPGRHGSLPQIWRGARSSRPKKLSRADSTIVDVVQPSTSALTANLSPDPIDPAELDTTADTSRYDAKLDLAPTPPTDECAVDDELLLLKPEEASSFTPSSRRVGKLPNADRGSSGGDGGVPAWRFGPAQYWYDQMGVADSGHGFDYGMKLKKKPTAAVGNDTQTPEFDIRKSQPSALDVPEETFLPIVYRRWEDDIITDPEKTRIELFERYKTREQPICGWIPTMQTRTYESFMIALKTGSFAEMFVKGTSLADSARPKEHVNLEEIVREPGPNRSIFPPDNYEYITKQWEDDIIYDAENMDSIPEPKVLTLDITEDPKLYGIPEDRSKEDEQQASTSSAAQSHSDSLHHRDQAQFTRRSKLILGQVEQRRKQEEEEELEQSMAQMTDTDPFNLSNDEFYMPSSKAAASSSKLPFAGAAPGASSAGSSTLIRHSIPAQNIHRAYFPTHLPPDALRRLHRRPLKKAKGPMSKLQFCPIESLVDVIKKAEEMRERRRREQGGGELFFMRATTDVSAKDGDLVLCEYSEQHPPLVQMVGMATKIRNYYKRKAGKESEPEFRFGETAFTHTSPFLGNLAPGQALQALECNLFRAPIYEYTSKITDFIVIRNRKGYFLRSCPPLFCVGQMLPLYEVPSPNSKAHSNFIRDFLLAFIYRLFATSDTRPKTLRMEDVKSAFPDYAESSVRKRLKNCADFKRLAHGPEHSFWVLKPDFRLPSIEEIQAMVTPEMCCAHYSMAAAEQRLKDAGYGEKYFFASENDDDDDDVTMEDEIKCAPWNTTRAYLSAMRGKCLLDQTGIADPTGCGEGFSFVRVSAKPAKEDVPSAPKRLVTGTSSDLRKLPLVEAKQMLRDFGVREDEINSLTRWEIIDVIRTLSTQQAKKTTDLTGLARFARGNLRFNIADMREKYKKGCQNIFDLQNRTLASTEVLSTDEESSEEDSDIEEMGKDVESMVLTGPRHHQKARQREAEAEEREREELKRLMLNEDSQSGLPMSQQSLSGIGRTKIRHKKKVMKISRIQKNAEGKEVTKTEIVRNQQVIEAYVKIRQTRDDAFIRHFAQMDEDFKEEKRKEKRRLQDQLRRIKKNEDKVVGGSKRTPLSSHKLKRPGPTTPMSGRLMSTPSSAATDTPPKKKPKKEKPINPNLAKMKCSACGMLGHMKTNKNCPLYGKSPKQGSVQVTKTDEEIEQMVGVPDVPQADLVNVDGTKVKFHPSLRKVAEEITKQSMKMTIPKHILHQHGGASTSGVSSSLPASPKADIGISGSPPTSPESNREPLIARLVIPREFLKQNPSSSSQAATTDQQKLRRGSTTSALQQLAPEEYIDAPKQTVHRARTDPKVSLSLVLEEVVNELRTLPGVEDLLQPVNKRKVPDYYDLIERPMDLQQIRMNIKANEYETREAFLADVKQILDNSFKYNGPAHAISMAAQQMFELTTRRVMEKEQKLMKLERSINPLLDDNDQVAFSYVLKEIIQACKNLPKSIAFHQPVDTKKYPTYLEKVHEPMDLGTMDRRVQKHRYTSVEAFVADIQRIRANCQLFNGPPPNLFTLKAIEIEQLAMKMIDQYKDHLLALDASIQRTLDAVETESFVTAVSSVGGDTVVGGVGPSASRPVSPTSLAAVMPITADQEDTMPYEGGDMGEEDYDPTEDLLSHSSMFKSGVVNQDLALSDSDDDGGDEEGGDSDGAESKRLSAGGNIDDFVGDL